MKDIRMVQRSERHPKRPFKRSQCNATVVLILFLFLSLLVSDFLFKFLVIGSAGTGKSCLLHQFIENKCKPILMSHSHKDLN